MKFVCNKFVCFFNRKRKLGESQFLKKILLELGWVKKFWGVRNAYCRWYTYS